MTETHDRLGRRSRLRVTSTGKRVSPTARDYLWFAKLAEHGPLPSSFLTAFAKGSHKSEKRAKERLTDLFSEGNTPHGGPYLVRPPQQFRTIDSRYNQLVYDLAAAAKQALANQHRNPVIKPVQSGPWLHSFMVSCITASIELACLDRDDLNYIPQSHILRRANADLRWPTIVAHPKTGATFTKDLIPDAVCGLEYKTGHSSRFRFFALEADRTTEPATSANFNRKSFERHLLQYAEYVEAAGYRKHLNLSAPMLVLNVTSDRTRMERLIRLTAKHFPHGNDYQLFQHWMDFGPVFVPPKPLSALLNDEWRLSPRGGFNIGLP